MIVPLLKLHANALEELAAVLLRGLAQQTHRPRVGLLRAQHALDGGAFSGAVGAQQAEHRAAFYREIQMIHHGFSVIGFGEALRKDRVAHCSSLLTARSSI